MTFVNNDAQAALHAQLCALIAAHGPLARADAATDAEAAQQWLAAGFDDTEDVAEWLAARCFQAAAAQRLEQAGLTPTQAALRTDAGRAAYTETIAYKFSRDDLTLAEARRIITNEFWNT